MDCDLLVIGGGLAGLVAATEATARGLKVIVLDQEGEQNLGGQAFWSLGGLFFVDSPEQRWMRIRDNLDLARQDWMGSPSSTGPKTTGPRQWAEAYLHFAAGEKTRLAAFARHALVPGRRLGRTRRVAGQRPWQFRPPLPHHLGPPAPACSSPSCGSPARPRKRACSPSASAIRLMNSSPPTAQSPARAEQGLRPTPSSAAAGATATCRRFRDIAAATLVASGGIGGNHDLVRKNWPTDRLGKPPEFMVAGVPAHVDGRMIEITQAARGSVINADRMWHYTEGLRNWDRSGRTTASASCPAPPSLWLDAEGNRFPAPRCRLRHAGDAESHQGDRL